MRVDRKQLLLLVLFVGVVAGALWLRHYLSPGQVVRRQLAAAVAAFEEERLLGVMSRVSRSYGDQWGGSYESLGGNIQSVLDTYDDLRLDQDVERIEARDGEVWISLRFVLSGRAEGGRGAILGSSVDPCRATMRWVEEPPGWRFAETVALDIPEYREELDARRMR